MPRKNAPVEPVTGFRPKPMTRKVVADERFPFLAPAEGAEPFWAEIADDLTINDTERIPWNEGTLADQWAAIAPYVVAWNAIAYDPTTNTWESVPPPSVGGPDVFKTQRRQVATFIVMCLKFNADLNLPKEPKRSGGMDAG